MNSGIFSVHPKIVKFLHFYYVIFFYIIVLLKYKMNTCSHVHYINMHYIKKSHVALVSVIEEEFPILMYGKCSHHSNL